MKILLISGSDIQGGSSQVAHSLGYGLKEKGHEVAMWVGKKSGTSAWVSEVPPLEVSNKSLQARVLHRLGWNQLNLNSPRPLDWPKKKLKEFDLIHLHDLPAGFNVRGLGRLSKIRPTIWTIHSMAPLTGGCIYPYECERWRFHCGQCPQFGEWPLAWYHRDASREIRFIKKFFFRSAKFRVVTVSKWLEMQARESILQRKRIKTILNFADNRVFYEEDKREARNELGIPQDVFAVMFSVSGRLEDKRKGLDIIRKALAGFGENKPFIIPTGITQMGQQFEQLLREFPGLPPRHIAERDTLRKVYSAADLIWHPTRADTSSMVSLEAFACSRPVVAAAVGGVPEVFGNGKVGRLILPNDPTALIEKTREFMQMSPSELQREGKAALEWQKEEFSFERFIRRHERLYAECLGRQTA